MWYQGFGVLPWAVLIHLLVGPCAPEETNGLEQYDPRCVLTTERVCDNKGDLVAFELIDDKCVRDQRSLEEVSYKDKEWEYYFWFMNCTKSLGMRADQVPKIYQAMEQVLEKTTDPDQCESLRLTCRHWSCPSAIPTGMCFDDHNTCFRFLVEMPVREISTMCWDQILHDDKTEMLMRHDHPIYEYMGFCTAREMAIRRNLEFVAEELGTSKRGSAAREAFCGGFQAYILYFNNNKVDSDSTLKIDVTVYATIAAILIAIFGVNLFNFWGASRRRHLDRQVGEYKRQQMRAHYHQKIDIYMENKRKEKAEEHKEGMVEDFDRLPMENAEPRSSTVTKKSATKTGRKSALKGKKKSGRRSKTTTGKGKKSKTGKTSKSKGTTGKKIKKRKLKKVYKKVSKASATVPTPAMSKSKATGCALAPAVSKSKVLSASATTAKPITQKSGSKVTTGRKTSTKKGSKATGRKSRTVTFCSRSAGPVARKGKVPKRRKNKNKKRLVKVPVAIPLMHPNAAEIQKKIVGTYRPPVYDYEIVAEQKTQESELRSQEVIEKTQQSTKRQARQTPTRAKGKNTKKVSRSRARKTEDAPSEKTCIGSETARERSMSAKSKSKKAKGKDQAPKDRKHTLSEKTAEDSVAAAARKKNVKKPKEEADKKSKTAQKESKNDVLSERTALASEFEVNVKGGKKPKGKGKKVAKEQNAVSKKSAEQLSEKTARGSEVEPKSKGVKKDKAKKPQAKEQNRAGKKSHKSGEPLSEKTARGSEVEPRSKSKGHKTVAKDKKRAQRSAELLSEKTAVGSEADVRNKVTPKAKKEVSVAKKTTEGKKAASVLKPVERKTKAAAGEKKKDLTKDAPKGKEVPRLSKEKVVEKKSTKGSKEAPTPKLSTEKADKKSAKEAASKATVPPSKDSKVGKGPKEKSSLSTTGKPSSGSKAKYMDDPPTKAIKAAVKDNKEAARAKAAQKRMDKTNTI